MRLIRNSRGVLPAILTGLLLLPAAAQGPPTESQTKAPAGDTSPAAAASSPLRVSPMRGSQYRTISAALAKVRSGGTIRVQAGTYRESLVLDKPVEIVPDTPGTAAVPAGAVVIKGLSGPAVRMRAGTAALRGITLRSSAAPTVDVFAGKLLLEDCEIEGGVSARGATAVPQLRNCRIHGGLGVSVSEKADASLEKCEITGCEAAGIRCSSGAKINMQDCKVSGGRAVGILVDGAEAECGKTDFTENVAPGVSVRSEGKITLRGCNLQGNHGGGLLLTKHGHATLEDCNVAANWQCGLRAEGSELNARKCLIRDQRREGISFADHSTGHVEGCEIWNNAWSGIVVTTESAPSIRGCQIHDHGSYALLFTRGGGGTAEECNLSQSKDWPCLGVTTEADPVIRRCRIFNSRHEGVKFSDGGKGLLEGCVIDANAWSGATIETKSEPILRRCLIHDNGNWGVNVTTAAGGTLDNCRLRGNKDGDFTAEPGTHPVVKAGRPAHPEEPKRDRAGIPIPGPV